MLFPEYVPPKNIFNFFFDISCSIFFLIPMIPIGSPPPAIFPKVEIGACILKIDCIEEQ